MEQTVFSLKELCRVAGVTERTVRYYIKEGLLPSPSGSGAYSRYGAEHLVRLQLIRRLKEEFLPLSEIKTLLAGKTQAELTALDSPRPAVPYPDRLQTTLQPDPTSLRQQLVNLPPPIVSGGPLPVQAAFRPGQQGQSTPTASRLFFQPPIFQPDEPSVPSAPASSEPIIGDTWERVELAPGIELHVQKRVARQEREALRELLETAKRLLS